MTTPQILSWIFLAIAIAAGEKSSDINAISSAADLINHAVPTQQELQLSFEWLMKNDLIEQEGEYYLLTVKGKSEYEEASGSSGNLLAV